MAVRNRLTAVVAVLVLIIGASGCAYVDYDASTPVAEPGPDRAVVVFYSEGRTLFDGYLGVPIGVGELVVGALVAGSYFAVEMTPGTHVMWAETVKRNAVSLDVEAGERYYVSVHMGPGLVAPRPHLRAVGAAHAEPRMEGLRRVKPAYPWITHPPTFHGGGART